MKKSKFLGAFLAALLLIQSAALPAYAETEPTEPSETVQTGAQEETVPAETGESVPAETGETVPVSGTGGALPVVEDASIQSGCHGMDAMVPAADPQAYTAKAQSVFLYDMTSDSVLVSHNPDEKRYPASLTKVMTTLTALQMMEEQQIDPATVVTISEELPRHAEGATMDLQAGEQIPLIDLLYGIMVDSVNDACLAVAEFFSGSEEAFVAEMNTRAEALGCTGTHFTNSHGLHDESHYTTARDIAKMMRAAVSYELFRELYSTPEYEAPATNLSEPRHMMTANYLINESAFDLYFDSRAVGGKTGYTTPAGRCLASVSRSAGSELELLTVVMGATMRVAEDGFSILSDSSFEETRALMDFGFSTFMPAQVLSNAQSLGQFPVTGGDSDVQGRVKESVSTVLPIGSTVDSIRYEFKLTDDELHAPLEKDTPLGVVRVWYQDRCLAQQELYSSASVKEPLHLADFPERNPVSSPENRIDIRQVLIGMAILGVLVLAVMFIGRQIRYAIRRRQRKKRVEKRRAQIERDRRREKMQQRMREPARVPERRKPEQPRKKSAQTRRPEPRRDSRPSGQTRQQDLNRRRRG